jgi:hypothetical protein
VVDIEDSVAVALGWWVGGAEGSKCTKDQLKELSGLIRVRHLSTGRQPVCCAACACFDDVLWCLSSGR